MRALIIFAVVVIVASVTLVTEARRPTCNKKAFWRQVYKKNNRIGWDDYVTHVTGGSYLDVYIVYLGAPIGQFFKAEFQYSATADMTVNQLFHIFEMGSSACVPLNLTYTRTDKKVCKYGTETYLNLVTTFEVGGQTFPDRKWIFSQDPAKYLLLYTCLELLPNGRCSRGFLIIQIRDTRVSPALGDEIDLSSVPWDKVAYDLYKLTGLRFGDPNVIYTWLGQDCQIATVD